MNGGMADSKECPNISPRKPLCSTCEKLDLTEMLRVEKNQRPMGPLSDYCDPDCPFCSLISQSICLAWGAEWNSAKLCSATSRSPSLFIQSRSLLTVKENGRTTYPQPCLLVAIDQKPPNFASNRGPLREVDREKNRFVIAEIESLPGDSVPKEEYFLLRREVGCHVNIQLVKHWLDECKNHHLHSKKTMRECEDNLFHHKRPFRLVDVVDECLVQRAERCDYVALSYVWGTLPTVLLTIQENVKDLSVPKALSNPRGISPIDKIISCTIRDAMKFTQKIGIRHLWVDTLCIVQDDAEDRARLIGKMDEVYNSATLTIVAVHGDDADAGLRGISPRNGCPVAPARIKDNSDGRTLNLLLRLPSLCVEVRRSVWNTRGWTFQEQSLSQRCLYFTPEETFFNCPEVQWREGYVCGEVKRENFDVEVRTGPPWWSPKLRKDLDPTPYSYMGDVDKHLTVQDYQRAVQDYSRKKLTRPEDVLNAFQAIFNHFKRPGSTSELSIRQTQGISAHFLFQAILWFPSVESQNRICKSEKLEEPVERFSTWSWASWIGPIDFVFADNLWLSRTISLAAIMYIPIICWHYGDSNQSFWSHDLWTAAHVPGNTKAKRESDKLSQAKSYLKNHTGIDIHLLLDRSLDKVPSLRGNELGFFGPYLPSSEFRLSVTAGQHIGSLEVSAHHGEFRFDGEDKRVDELVGVVAADTVTKPARTQSILIGLVTRHGVSSRVGIGYIQYSEGPSALKPKWQYRFFTVR